MLRSEQITSFSITMVQRMPRRLSSQWVQYVRQSMRRLIISLRQARKSALSRFVFTDLSAQSIFLLLCLRRLSRFPYLTEPRNLVQSVSHFTLMLLQLLRIQSLLTFRYLQDVTDLVLRIQHLHRLSQYTITQRRRDLQSVSTMM